MAKVRVFLGVVLSIIFLVFSVGAGGVQDSVVASDAAAEPSLDTLDYYVVAYQPNDIQDRATKQEFLQEYLTILGYLPEDQYIVYAPSSVLDDFQERQIIASYHSYYDDDHVFFYKPGKYTVDLFSTATLSDVVATVKDLDAVSVLDQADSAFRVEVSDKDILQTISKIHGVKYVLPVPEYAVVNDVVNVIVGTEAIRTRYKLYGEGQIIGVGDTGLSKGVIDATLHEDLKGRVISLTDIAECIKWNVTWCSPLPDDKIGHGTHISGSALGNGFKSGSNPGQHQYTGSYAGAAPEAKLVFQAIGADTGGAVYPPWPIDSAMMDLAYQQGARIHTNSWSAIGSVFNGWYDVDAYTLDKYLFQKKDMTIVFAAGNDGPGAGTIKPPGTAKNVISVGAVEKTSPYNLASFSNRGPTRDGRFKPDIVSVGVAVASLRSSANPYPCGGPGNDYCTFSGTSTATPNIAGLTAVIREFYQTKTGLQNPSAALIKATLLNGGEPVGTYPVPSYEAGWGRVNLVNSLPADANDLAFFDVRQGLRTNEEKSFTLHVKAGTPLRIMIVWTDVEGQISFGTEKKLVNDLDLLVVDPRGTQYNGNDITAPFNDEWDRLNNVEAVKIQTPLNGIYTVKVKGDNIPKGPQDFALVATYDNADVEPIPPVNLCRAGQVAC